MKPFSQFPTPNKKNIDFILTDIDDTLTHKGRLPAGVFVAMERLKEAEIRTIPITGRPDGAITLRACGLSMAWWVKTAHFTSVTMTG